MKRTVMMAWAISTLLGSSTAIAAEKGAARADAGEPKIREVVQEALRYFRVNPEAIESLRSAARRRALLPLVAGGYRFDSDKLARFEEQTITDPRQNNEDTNRRTNSVSVGAVWDFRELVFNPAEVQAYGLVGVQRDLILEVTRTYYLRKQLVLLKRTKPPEDPVSLATLELRIEEYTALLDALTGGWFSRAADTDG